MYSNEKEGYDEYMSTDVQINESGMYTVFYRYSTDNGSTWTYCDKGGIATGVSVDRLWIVNVTDANSAKIEECNVTWPDTHFGVTPYAYKSSEAVGVYAQVKATGVTGQGGTHQGITAQFGYLDTVNDDKSYAAIHWVDAAYNSGFDQSRAPEKDEYMIANELKLPVGHYVGFYRFSTDNGSTWTVCDGVGILSSPDQLKYETLTFFDVAD